MDEKDVHPQVECDEHHVDDDGGLHELLSVEPLAEGWEGGVGKIGFTIYKGKHETRV